MIEQCYLDLLKNMMLCRPVSQDIEALKFNTAIASMMSLVNEIYDHGSLTRDEMKLLITILSPFAPHICEEINEQLGYTDIVSLAKWPEWDEAKTVDAEIEIAVQICGKLKATVMIPAGASNEEMLKIAKENSKIAELLSGKTVIKEICVPGKLVNIVAR